MASVRRHGKGWQARIVRKGEPTISKTLPTKAEALRWAAITEADLLRGSYVHKRESEKVTLKAALERYRQQISPSKKSVSVEGYRINYWQAQKLAAKTLAAITPADIVKWRDNRLAQGISPSTIQKELALLSHVYTIADKEWLLDIENPVTRVRRPKVQNARERRVSPEELAAILQHCSSELGSIVQLAIETAMRRGEIISLRWQYVDTGKRVAILPDTKNGSRRVVALSGKAVAVLQGLPKRADGRVFGLLESGISQGFRKACARARQAYRDNGGTDPDFLVGIHFHDLRHEATSRLFELGLSVMEVASMTGHKTLAMLKRYTHIDAVRLADKLQALA